MVWFLLDFIDFETVFTVIPGTMFDFGDGGFRLMPIIPPRCHQEVTKCDKQSTPSEDMSLEWLGTMSPPTLWRINKSPTRISFGRRYNRLRWPSRTSYITWRSTNLKHTSKQQTLNVLSIWHGRLYQVTYQMKNWNGLSLYLYLYLYHGQLLLGHRLLCCSIPVSQVL